LRAAWSPIRHERKLGPIFLGGDHECFWPRLLPSRSTFSEDVNCQFDSEVRRLRESASSARLIILKATRVLERLADTLIQREKIDRGIHEDCRRQTG
jgi:ATP-dependent Zn protease